MLPEGQHPLCWDHTWSKEATGYRLIHLSSYARTPWACNWCVCIWCPLLQHLCPLCLSYHCLWWHSCHFHAHAHEGAQCLVSLSNVWDPRYSHPGLVKQDALCTSVPLQSPYTNWCYWVSSREVTAVLAQWLYGTGWSSGVRAHGNTVREACKGVWHQRSPTSQCSWFPEVSPVISIWLYASDLGKPHPKSCSLLVQLLQGNGQGSAVCPGAWYLAGHWFYLYRSFKNDTFIVWCIYSWPSERLFIFHIFNMVCVVSVCHSHCASRLLPQSILLQTFLLPHQNP